MIRPISNTIPNNNALNLSLDFAFLAQNPNIKVNMK